MSIARERFGGALAVQRFRPCWSALAALPQSTKQEGQKNEENTDERRKSQVKSHHQPFHSGGRPKTNTRVTSRKLAHHTLSVNRSRFPL
jgi:hypothetical protein